MLHPTGNFREALKQIAEHRSASPEAQGDARPEATQDAPIAPDPHSALFPIRTTHRPVANDCDE